MAEVGLSNDYRRAVLLCDNNGQASRRASLQSRRLPVEPATGRLGRPEGDRFARFVVRR